MRLLADIDARVGFAPVPWSVPSIGTGVSRAGRRYRFARRDKKSDPCRGVLGYEDWIALVRRAAEAQHHGDPYPAGPVFLDLVFLFPVPSGARAGQLVACPLRRRDDGRWVKVGARTPDLTNLAKGVEDALEGIVYGNDVQVRMKREIALYGPVPGVRARVYAIETGDFPGSGPVQPGDDVPCPARPRRAARAGRSGATTRPSTPSASDTASSPTRRRSPRPPGNGSPPSGP